MYTASPWSNAAKEAESTSKWPAILNAGGTFYVWRERSRNCWEATGTEGFVVRVAVVETADGTGDTWVGHTISDNLGAGAVENIYFRMLDVLADRLRTEDPEAYAELYGVDPAEAASVNRELAACGT